ncbi:MAG TPA: hypothetical protein VLL51_06735, partial [Gemmatimonadales bacterium]|nr:hypothetical protein [Gemmatimonadales bacterium]
MSASLRDLERIHRQYGPGLAGQKRLLLDRIQRQTLPTARAVSRFHEVLCFLRAYPDSPELLQRVEEILEAFPRRRDLRRHARALQDSGIAGTPTYYLFFEPTARWLASRWPGQLTISWEDVDHPERLERILPLLGLYAESPGIDEAPLTARQWLQRMKGPGETDASFLIRRIAEVRAAQPVREIMFEDLGVMYQLAAGPDTPARTHARVARRVHYVTEPLDQSRPDLAVALRERPRSVRPVPRAEAEQLIDLAREAMVSRSRDLDNFAYGDPDDVRIVDMGDGLEFVAVGLIPERRLLLEAVYGFLTLKNGVPIGYVLNSALYGSAEVAYNVFDTYRGGEAARVYGKVLAMLRHLFQATAFTIYPYQLGGEGNDEGLTSGAWWFYQKLGFRPREPEATALMESELAEMRRSPGHRSSRATLKRLAEHNLYYHIGRPREDVIGLVPLANVGLAITDFVARRFGSRRDEADRVLDGEMARLLGTGRRRGWTEGE